MRIRHYKEMVYSIWLKSSVGEVGSNTVMGINTRFVGPQFFAIGDNCRFGEHNMLAAWSTYNGISYSPSVTIGNNCNFGFCNHITCCNKISIGNNVLTGMYVLISDNSHGEIVQDVLEIPPLRRPLFSKGEIVIDDNVWIGNNVAILAGVHIGEGAIIAANAVVTKDVPKFCVAAGIPAKVIKRL